MVKKKDLEKIGLEPQPLKFDDFVARCLEKLELILFHFKSDTNRRQGAGSRGQRAGGREQGE